MVDIKTAKKNLLCFASASVLAYKRPGTLRTISCGKLAVCL
jgi:hypothetical protein